MASILANSKWCKVMFCWRWGNMAFFFGSNLFVNSRYKETSSTQCFDYSITVCILIITPTSFFNCGNWYRIKVVHQAGFLCLHKLYMFFLPLTSFTPFFVIGGCWVMWEELIGSMELDISLYLVDYVLIVECMLMVFGGLHVNCLVSLCLFDVQKLLPH